MREHLLEEILSQPAVWRKTLSSLFRTDVPFAWLDGLVGDGPVLFTGMGSSYFASLAAAPPWGRIVRGQALAASASDLLTNAGDFVPRGSAGTVVGISRSGKTFETRDAVRLLRKEYGWASIGVTCHEGTPLSKACDGSLLLGGAAERSRFTTRAFTTMILALHAFAAARARDRRLEAELRRLPDLAEGLFARYGDAVEGYAARGGYGRFMFLAQGPGMGLAKELALKVEEIVRVPAEACRTLEYLHGPKYAADRSTLVTVLLADGREPYQGEALGKILRGKAPVAVVCERAPAGVAGRAGFVIELRSGLSCPLSMVLAMPLLQLFIYHRAVAAGRSDWLGKMVYPPRPKTSLR